MDNNNSIPYGAVTWQNDGIARERHQRAERQAISQRPPALTNSGATFSFVRPSPGPQNTQNSILTGAFNGLRNSSRTTQQNNFATLQQPATGYSNVATGVHNSPPVSGTVEYNSHSPMFSRINMSGYHELASSVDSPCIGQSRQRIQAERMGTAQAGATRPKRKITDYGNDATGPSSKQLLTERMAAKMYNLRISNDVCSHSRMCSLRPDHLDSESQKGSAASTDSSHSFSSMEEEQEEEEKDKGRNDIPTFVLASGVKEALKKSDNILPDAIIRQVNSPCLAVIPWQPVSSLPLVDINIISDKEESITKDPQKSYSKASSCVDDQIIIVDQDLPLVNTKGTLPCNYGSFSLDDDDDMDL